MKKNLLAVAATLAAAAIPTIASAQLAFNVGAVTDYRYRGLSQSQLKPALQGGVDYTAGGFYVGAWASTIRWVKKSGGDANVEIDLYAGYKGEIAKDFGYDVGVLTYIYPSNKLSPSANTTELYGAATLGPATLKYSHSVSNLFGFANSKNSGYLDLSASFDLGDGWSLAPHIGRQRVAHNSLYSYTDYSLAVNKDIDGLVLSATLVGTDADQAAYTTSAAAGGKFLGKSGLLLSVKKNF